MPLELVMDGIQQDRPPTMEITIGDRLFEVEPVDSQNVKIVRLLRCQLDDYLNPAFMPGQMIRFSALTDQDEPRNDMV